MPISIMKPPKAKYIFQIPPLPDEKRTTPKFFCTNKYFIGKLIREMRAGYSPIVTVCGEQRIGKSFTAVLLAHLISTAFGKYFNVKEQCFYEPFEAIKSLDDAYEEVRILDESGAMIGNRQWHRVGHEAIEKTLQTQGNLRILWLIISPFIVDIDKKVTKHFSKIIHCLKRGEFKVYNNIKKHNAMYGKPSIVSFLDYVSLNKKDMPMELWEEYEKYSFSEKKRLRHKYKDMTKTKRNNKNKWAKFMEVDSDGIGNT